jgi:cytochrome c oxidase assembly protein subunit 15
MPTPPLYDLSPLLSVLGLGTLIACLPLFLAAWRHRQGTPAKRRLALTALTLFLTLDLILVGSFTRLTDSGLGCPDWPGCYGQSSPLGAAEWIQAQQEQLPSGPVTHQKAWIEMVHRYLATGVGGLILVMLTLTLVPHLQSRWKRPAVAAERPAKPASDATGSELGSAPGLGWALATLVWVCLQGAFGALTVTMKLFPAIVSLHLLGSYVLLAMLTAQWVRWSQVVQAQQRGLQGLLQRGAGIRLWPLLICLGLVIAQACSGAWVSSNYAVLACQDFPTCQGSWWPPMNFKTGFEMWRPLGMRGDGSVLDFQALTAIHFFHRLLAAITALGLVVLVWQTRKSATLRRPTRWLVALLCLQLLTGMANVVLDWPLLGAMLHTAGAGGLVAVLVWMITLSGLASPIYRRKEMQ